MNITKTGGKYHAWEKKDLVDCQKTVGNRSFS